MNASNLQLIEQYFEYFNNHQWQQMADLYIENPEFKDPSLGPSVVHQSREDIVNKYSELRGMFPDVQDRVLQTYPSGDQHVIVEFLSTGTAPDGTEFELPICTIFSIENGKITKDYTYYDNFES